MKSSMCQCAQKPNEKQRNRRNRAVALNAQFFCPSIFKLCSSCLYLHQALPAPREIATPPSVPLTSPQQIPSHQKQNSASNGKRHKAKAPSTANIKGKTSWWLAEPRSLISFEVSSPLSVQPTDSTDSGSQVQIGPHED